MGDVGRYEREESEARWLLVDEAPALSGAGAAAVVGMLQALALAIDEEYAAEIIAHWQRETRHRNDTGWWEVDERQLRLDLSDDDYF